LDWDIILLDINIPGRNGLEVLSESKRLRPQEAALFLNRKGERMPYHTLLRLIHQYAGRQHLDVNVTPHTFRRSCTTELIRAGANLYHVKELLGHESLETLRHYTRLTIVDLKKTHEACHPREREA
jgi:integrase/recombinase XerD